MPFHALHCPALQVYGAQHYETAQAVTQLAGFIMGDYSRLAEGQVLMDKAMETLKKARGGPSEGGARTGGRRGYARKGLLLPLLRPPSHTSPTFLFFLSRKRAREQESRKQRSFMPCSLTRPAS